MSRADRLRWDRKWADRAGTDGEKAVDPCQQDDQGKRRAEEEDRHEGQAEPLIEWKTKEMDPEEDWGQPRLEPGRRKLCVEGSGSGAVSDAIFQMRTPSSRGTRCSKRSTI